MIFTILISIVFIAEIIITIALVKSLKNFDKKVCELNNTIILLKPQIKDISELSRKISEQLKEFASQ